MWLRCTYKESLTTGSVKSTIHCFKIKHESCLTSNSLEPLTAGKRNTRVEGTKTDILDRLYHNFYSFYTNEMDIITKHSFPYSPYSMYVFVSFWVSIYLFFRFFKLHQKWCENGLGYKNGHLEKNHTKCSKLIFICSIHKHTC